MATTECDRITRALRRWPAADSVLWRFWEGQGSLGGSKTAGDVFTFGVDLGEWGLTGGLPTG
jgi:hypothetical protein